MFVCNYPESICKVERIAAKILSLHRDYKDACEKVNQSGYGLEGDAHRSFFEYIYTVCK